MSSEARLRAASLNFSTSLVVIGEDCEQIIADSGAITADLFVAIQELDEFLVDLGAALEHGLAFLFPSGYLGLLTVL